MVVSPMAELDCPLLISALWDCMPVPLKVQETGTVMLIWSTTEVLSSAEAVLEDRIMPERKVNPRRLSEALDMSLFMELS